MKAGEIQSHIGSLINTSNDGSQRNLTNLKINNPKCVNFSASEVYGNKKGGNQTSKTKKDKFTYQPEKKMNKSDSNSKSINSSRSRENRENSIGQLKEELAQVHSYYKKKLEAERERYEHVSVTLKNQIERTDELDKFCCDLQKQLMLKDNQINELKVKLNIHNENSHQTRNSNVNVDHTSVQNIKQYHQTDLIMQQLKEEREYRDRTERRIQELK